MNIIVIKDLNQKKFMDFSQNVINLKQNNVKTLDINSVDHPMHVLLIKKNAPIQL